MLYQCQLAFITLTFCLVWWYEAKPRLERIEIQGKNNAAQVEDLHSKYDALDEKLMKYVSEEKWQQAKKTIQR